MEFSQAQRRVIEAARKLDRIATPFGAYVSWSRDGNTVAADKLQAWEDARLELEHALIALDES